MAKRGQGQGKGVPGEGVSSPADINWLCTSQFGVKGAKLIALWF